MRALVLDAGGGVRFTEEHADPAAAPGEAIVRVRLAGICGTDLEMCRGYAGPDAPSVPGHEFVGVVESAAGPTGLVGRRVVAEINLACGTCRRCRAGRRTHCTNRKVLGIRHRDGAFAERIAVPLASLHVVPDAVPDDAAVFAEPVAAALRIVEQTSAGDGVRVVVCGDGRLGLLCAIVLCAAGADVALLGRDPAKLALAGALGLRAVADETAVEPEADLVVDATGSPDGLRLALRLVRPQGTVVVKTTCATDRGPAIDWNRVVIDEITIAGSRCGPMDRALELLASGAVDPLPLISARFPLDRGAEAFAAATGPGVVKVLLEIP